VKIFVENQLPPAFARFVVQKLGVHAIHVADIELEEATDLEIWRYATAENLILASFQGRRLPRYNFDNSYRATALGSARELPGAYLLESFRRLWPSIHDQAKHPRCISSIVND
jgi:hypothetical protein